MKFGTWIVRSMYGAGSLRTVVEEISKYKLDLVGVQQVRGFVFGFVTSLFFTVRGC
jgi:hypothetical protein